MDEDSPVTPATLFAGCVLSGVVSALLVLYLHGANVAGDSSFETRHEASRQAMDAVPSVRSYGDETGRETDCTPIE